MPSKFLKKITHKMAFFLNGKVHYTTMGMYKLLSPSFSRNSRKRRQIGKPW